MAHSGLVEFRVRRGPAPVMRKEPNVLIYAEDCSLLGVYIKLMMQLRSALKNIAKG